MTLNLFGFILERENKKLALIVNLYLLTKY